ncbi:hypothetical protein [Wolbachia endosymbiont (group A) of Apoderus coryli]|nr:hypothetical protein [Wolbachia endosymbiont (group A) of Apoderus coryli]
MKNENSLSRYLLAESMLRGTTNELRYDGSRRDDDKLVIPLLVSG